MDRDLLELICWLRVVTQTQLEALSPDVSVRTLRYRTRRLHQLGLVGRSRPYRERGSAAHHLWPMRRADALVRGDPWPRRGERREPNPLFLAHTATISELYVALVCAPPPGLTGSWIAREGDARESFQDSSGRERAVAPDATIALQTEDERELIAMVELDLGTMSRTRLGTKARGYAAYHQAGGWRGRHPYCPPLLFATTGQARAQAFGSLLAAELSKFGRADSLAFATCAYATNLRRALSTACWHRAGSAAPVDLRAVLAAAREPYDNARANQQAERERYQQMLSDPVGLRTHLRCQQPRAAPELLDDLGPRAGSALERLLSGQQPPDQAEYHTLRRLSTEIDDRHGLAYATLRPSIPARAALDELADHYAELEREGLDSLKAYYGEGPHLRRAQRRLDAGQLLGREALGTLVLVAQSDGEQRERQALLRTAYGSYREQQARRDARQQGLAARLRGPNAHLQAVDERLLRLCPTCQETAYPDLAPPAGRAEPPTACPYCHSAGLVPSRASVAERDGRAGCDEGEGF